MSSLPDQSPPDTPADAANADAADSPTPGVAPADDAWAPLRASTPARIGLGRVGTAPSLASVLALRTAHAAARDAVWTPPDWHAIEAGLDAAGIAWLSVSSQVPDRATYLLRPDLGRVPDESSRARLAAYQGDDDIAVVLVDGLSGEALSRHGVAVVAGLVERLRQRSWRVAPVVCVRQGRVAIGDAIGADLGAHMVLVVIGERPGLSASDSLGLYLTYDPRPGRMDSERNCISNVRPGGLPIDQAVAVAEAYAVAARQQSLTGTGLHIESLAEAQEPDFPVVAGPDATDSAAD